MGGKTIKYPKRPKYVFKDKKPEKFEEKLISENEHEERLRKLKEMGLLK